MCMRMQPFLCVAEQLSLETALPAEVTAALAERGFPPLARAEKTRSGLHEHWLLEFSSPVEPAVAQLGPRGDPLRATVHILGAQLGDEPVFSTSKLVSSASVARSLILAQAASVAVPQLWFNGEIKRRGPYARLPFVVCECASAATARHPLLRARPPCAVTNPPRRRAGASAPTRWRARSRRRPARRRESRQISSAPSRQSRRRKLAAR